MTSLQAEWYRHGIYTSTDQGERIAGRPCGTHFHTFAFSNSSTSIAFDWTEKSLSLLLWISLDHTLDILLHWTFSACFTCDICS